MAQKNIKKSDLPSFVNCIDVLHNIFEREKQMALFFKKYPDLSKNKANWHELILDDFNETEKNLQKEAKKYDKKIDKIWGKNIKQVNAFEAVDAFLKWFSSSENRVTITICALHDRLDLLNYIKETYPERLQEIASKNNKNTFSCICYKEENEEFNKYFSWFLKNGFSLKNNDLVDKQDAKLKFHFKNTENFLISYLLLQGFMKNTHKGKEKIKYEEKITSRVVSMLENGLKINKVSVDETGKGILYHALDKHNTKMHEVLIKNKLKFSAKEAIDILERLHLENSLSDSKQKGTQNYYEEYKNKIEPFFNFIKTASSKIQNEVIEYINKKNEKIQTEKMEWNYILLKMENVCLKETIKDNNRPKNIKLL